jgi:hypothetical protein
MGVKPRKKKDEPKRGEQRPRIPDLPAKTGRADKATSVKGSALPKPGSGHTGADDLEHAL